MDGMDGGGRDGRTETRSGGLQVRPDVCFLRKCDGAGAIALAPGAAGARVAGAGLGRFRMPHPTRCLDALPMCEQARVSFEDDDSRDVMTRSEPGALEHAGSALSLLATPAHRKDASAAKSLGSYSERPPDSRAASARRTKKKKGPVDTPDAATPDSLSALAPSASAAGAMMDLAIPLTFEEMDVRSARSTPSAAAATFREVLVSCSCDFESAAEKVSTELLLVEGVGCQPIPAACALGVMAQACAWLNTMLGKDERVLDQMATEALQGIGFSLCVLSCKVEQEQGCQRGDELEDQRKELMERSVELLGACLRRWSWASVEEGGERSAHKRARAAALSDRLSIAAASMQALDKCARDASNASLWMAIMKLALHAVLCEQLPEVQAEGMKLLKSLFASNAEQRCAVLEEVSLSCSLAPSSLFLSRHQHASASFLFPAQSHCALLCLPHRFSRLASCLH
jgi:hypothetical protein